MKLRKIYFIATVLFCICITTPIVAQTGGRKKEHRNQKGKFSLFHRKKSGGHADSFAKGGTKKGFFAKIFKGKKNGGAWVYHKTNPGKKQNKEQGQLFSRFRTKNKRYNDGLISSQNIKRAGERKRNRRKI